ncbi:hypothetical protein CLCR_09373 [Cladophialophora carrionii]|uniref:Uncharacterized protein n=1 Tax=Cladophialophora carrionii TaxID=86049 RepID=A0A1C1CSQ9_9EURO|nr:hypothetical protein CLCR_09373 [Cladophialophora carrionii]
MTARDLDNLQGAKRILARFKQAFPTAAWLECRGIRSAAVREHAAIIAEGLATMGPHIITAWVLFDECLARFSPYS